ncbi:MAG: hypothetical protein PHH06_00690 [Candidatus Gracilibacteria bacterium]|nr:hypothetical protein [Candidatus Gracilibacteria bacterium]
METLLLTGTISPSKDIKKQGYKSTSIKPKERYFEYINSIIYYITQSDFKNIVFCENSNYNFKDLDLINELCKLYNKNFELLQFNGDHKKSLELGYGYGDGECMDFAVDNSQVIKSSKNWYKISGRYIIKNINEIIKIFKDKNVYFFKGTNIDLANFSIALFSISTYFFKTNSLFYKENLYNIKSNIHLKTSIEFEFYKELRFLLDYTNIKSNILLPIENRYYKKFKNINYLGLLDLGFISYIIDKLLFNFLHKKS